MLRPDRTGGLVMQQLLYADEVRSLVRGPVADGEVQGAPS